MLENSLKSSVGFELSQDSLYCTDAGSPDDLDSPYPQARIKATLQHFVGFSLLCDGCFLMAAFALSPLSFGTLLKAPASNTLLVSALLTAACLIVFYVSKLYRIETIANFRFFCARFSVILLSVLVVSEIENFMISPTIFPLRTVHYSIIAWTSLTLLLFFGLRYITAEGYRLLVARGYVSHQVAVIGTSSVAESFINDLHADRLGVRVRAVFDDADPATRPLSVAGVTVRGGVPTLLQYTKHHRIDTVVIASEYQAGANVRPLVAQIAVQPLRIAILPPPLVAGIATKNTSFAHCAPAGTLPGVDLMHLVDVPIRGLSGFMKSALDVTVALTALLLFAPLMLICAGGIKLTSPGPVFFRQSRIGYRNKEFMIFKFRTMHLADCNSSVLTTRNDPRIFKFGEILRKLSLDELPQLFNVLKGDMSLVGPRPHIQQARAAGILYFRAVPSYPARHRVKPGITGRAQVSGWRGPTETIEQIENRVAHDLHYVENWSLLGDIKILIKTVFVGFFNKNAF